MLGDYLGLTCAALILTALASAVALESYIPKEDIELFVVQHLDLSTFRNSLGPQRKPGQRIFEDFGIAPTSIKKNEVEIDSEDWRYHIKILRRADINKDGIEDLEICFIDRAKQGSYNTSKPLLITRFSKTGYLVALDFEVDGCPNYAK